MCGIVGYVDFSGFIKNSNLLKKLASKIIHRGPDDQGFFIEKNIAIAHKRLSIIDLSKNANQPMVSSCKNYIIAYNGEIYNFKTIKQKLLKLGYRFSTESDTEVLLNAYIEYGSDVVDHLNGMFAFVIYDKTKNKIFCFRDRYGIKPLYYYKNNEVFIFSSEIKAITAHDKFQKNINYNGIKEYFTFQNLITNKTFFEDVFLLEQGSFLVINLDNNKCTNNKYWDYNFSNKIKISTEDSLEQLEHLLDNSIKLQSVADVKVGAFLSGGIDSSLISFFAKKYIPNLKTFNAGFNSENLLSYESNYDESFSANEISKLIGSTHYSLTINPSDFISSNLLVSNAIEEPRVGQSYANLLISKFSKKYVKVCLSGVGGDELFAGYPWRYNFIKNVTSYSNFEKFYFNYWNRLVDKNIYPYFFKKIFSNYDYDALEVFKKTINPNNNSSLSKDEMLDRVLYFECKTFLNGLLVIEDKLSMSNSLETRVPFLDNNLVDFSMTIPNSHKINLFNNKNFSGKLILRNLAKKKLSKKISIMQKQGFSSPDASWYTTNLKQYIHDKLSDKNLYIYNFIDFTSVKSILNDHFNLKRNNKLLIWSILMFNNFLSINF